MLLQLHSSARATAPEHVAPNTGDASGLLDRPISWRIAFAWPLRPHPGWRVEVSSGGSIQWKRERGSNRSCRRRRGGDMKLADAHLALTDAGLWSFVDSSLVRS